MAPRFELGIEALQAPALPLGYATVQVGIYPDRGLLYKYLLTCVIWKSQICLSLTAFFSIGFFLFS